MISILYTFVKFWFLFYFTFLLYNFAISPYNENAIFRSSDGDAASFQKGEIKRKILFICILSDKNMRKAWLFMREKLKSLPLVELKQIAKENHIKNVSTLRKAQLIDVILERLGSEQAPTPEAAHPQTSDTVLSDNDSTAAFKSADFETEFSETEDSSANAALSQTAPVADSFSETTNSVSENSERSTDSAAQAPRERRYSATASSYAAARNNFYNRNNSYSSSSFKDLRQSSPHSVHPRKPRLRNNRPDQTWQDSTNRFDSSRSDLPNRYDNRMDSQNRFESRDNRMDGQSRYENPRNDYANRSDYSNHSDYVNRYDNSRSDYQNRYNNSGRDYGNRFDSSRSDYQNRYNAVRNDYTVRNEFSIPIDQSPRLDSINRNDQTARTDYQNRPDSLSRFDNAKRDDFVSRFDNDAALPEGCQPACGILDIRPDGYGFLRSANFLSGQQDVYVAPSQIRRFGMRTGDMVDGFQKANADDNKYDALIRVNSINGFDPELSAQRPNFEKLTPIFPNSRLSMEVEGKSTALRIVDLISPVGKGQRGMIVSPPKAGKTTLLKELANAITHNYPDMNLIILLIDERPEEVTDIRESIQGEHVEVIYSTFDETPDHHKQVAEMVLERAKRLVEHKQDVMILLDSLTRLARSYNLTVTPSGRTLSGGLDPAALHMPKKFFGAARNMREGGSLTILATALVETGSRLDDMVFEEFKGTGNMELVLDRKLSERRIFPAIDIVRSGTRREDLLLTPEESNAVSLIRRSISGLKNDEAIEQILNHFVHTKNNAEFVATLPKLRS